MNGLDLTPWVKENDSVRLTVEQMNHLEYWRNVGFGLIVAAIVLFILVGLFADSFYDRVEEGTHLRMDAFFTALIILSPLLLFGGFAVLVVRDAWVDANSETLRERQTESLESYIGDGYAVDLGCYGGLPIVSELPESHDGQKYDCRITFRNPDMTHLDNMDEQDATLLLRDDRAYLYDKDGNLMEVKE